MAIFAEKIKEAQRNIHPFRDSESSPEREKINRPREADKLRSLVERKGWK